MDHLPTELVTPDTYALPQARARNRVRDTIARTRIRLGLDEKDQTELVPDDLEAISEPFLSKATWERLEAHVFDLLDEMYADWIEKSDSPHKVCACLALASAPPDLFSRWSALRGHATLDDASPDNRRSFAVVPTFDTLIDRSLAGLDRVRDFTARIDAGRTKLLLCGTSIQWRYLARVSSLDLVASDIRMIPPFDAKALAALLSEDPRAQRIRSRNSGGEILEMEGDKLKDDYLTDRAADARGCPWAALELMETATTQRQVDGKQTARWVGKPEVPTLPARHERAARFFLHGLMLHGVVAPDQVATIAPHVPDGLVRALMRQGLVREADARGRLRIVPRMAPYIRRQLADAGFPVGEV